MDKKIIEALKKVCSAEAHLAETIRANLPVDSLVTFTKGRGQITGQILRYGGNSKTEPVIRNVKTGKEYRVSIYDLLTRVEWKKVYDF